MVDAVKRLEAAENLCQEIITEEIQIAKRAEVAVTGFLRSLVYAAGFDVLVWTRISRQSGMECSTLKPLVTVTLGFLALGTMLSAFCAYRKVQKISTHASCLLHRLRGVTVLLASFPQDGGEESKALQKCNIVASYLLHRLRHVAELLKNFLRGGGNASPAGNQSVSPAAATAEYNPTPTASGESEIKLNNLRKMRRELSFQLKWLRAIYLWRIFFLLIPMLLLITWELAFVDKCYGGTKYSVPAERWAPAERSSPELWWSSRGARRPSRSRRGSSGFRGNNFQDGFGGSGFMRGEVRP